MKTEARPRLAVGVRLRYEPVRTQWFLLAPEGVVTLSETAAAVLGEVDGARSVGAIVEGLVAAFGAPREVISHDVEDLLGSLYNRGLVELDAP